MSVTGPDVPSSETNAAATPAVPKRIVNAQTVCNEKNEKGKLCNGHLKQTRTAGEPAEIHLRGDDVLFKCQTCGTLYMGPPLGHVRDPHKQSRFVEAELSALLQAAGGTLPVVKKDPARGVYVLVEAGGEQHAAPAPPKPAAPKAAPVKAPAPPPAAPTETPAQPAAASPPPAPKPAEPTPAAAATTVKPGAAPNRELFRRSTYVGVKDTGPVAGETFEQKVERLKMLSAAAKQRAEEGGEPSHAAAAPAPVVEATPVAETPAAPSATQEPVAPAPSPTVEASSAAHQPSGKGDRTLFRRSTYCGVVDTGPVAGETFAEKVERLSKLAAAAKQRSEGG